MTNFRPKLETARACRVVRLDRDILNEAISSGVLPCVPRVEPGRPRYYDPDDMLALWLYRELRDDGVEKATAGEIACAVADAARQYPDARAISYVQDYFQRAIGSNGGSAYPADAVPAHSEWDEVLFSGTDVRKVTTFRIGKMRELIEVATAHELSHHD
jgi:hypothetical protein